MDAELGWGTLKLPWKQRDQRFLAGLNDGIAAGRFRRPSPPAAAH
jgi:hypothetical protein